MVVMSADTSTQPRRYVVEWWYIKDMFHTTVEAHDVKEARRLFRQDPRSRRLGYGLTILKITLHPEDRKPSPIGRKKAAPQPDRLGNVVAQEGCDFCFCGCKYWENDKCVDCGTKVTDIPRSVLERHDA